MPISNAPAHLLTLAIVTVCTAVSWVLSRWLVPTNLAMVYVLGVVVIAARGERTHAVVGAILSVLAFDFFFVPPVFTLRFADAQYVVAAIALLVVGLVISTFAARARTAAAAALAAQDERLRSSLLASISHDLRTPLAVIAGSASSLRDEDATLAATERAQLLDTLCAEAQHMSLMVSDLLEMTRLHARPVALNRQWYPAEELVGAALERCKGQLSRHRLRIGLPADLPMLHVDGVLLEKLLVNLVENAIKYTSEGTLIAISAERLGDVIKMRVEDDGPGLPAGAEEQVFQKFYRAAPEGPASGSGLGLSICRAIAEAHGGSITARNRVAGGACLELSLPYERTPQAEAR